MLEGEQQYIEQAQQGTPEAFGKLYDHYFPKIYRFILLKVSNKVEAQDLTHEAFLNAWKHIRGYHSRGLPFSSWVYQIARNKVIDFYRTKRQHTNIDDLEEQHLKIPATAQQDLNQKLTLERIQKLIPRLSHDQQDVLLMRFVEDLSHQEIAATLNKSEGAIRILQHRALNGLKELIDDEYGTLA